MTTTGHPRVRRVLTGVEIDRLAGAITVAASSGDLIASTIGVLYEALLADTGDSLADFGPQQRLDPAAFAIPHIQLEALLHAATSRAAQWGTSIHVALTLATLMPCGYHDPHVPAPDFGGADHRPAVHELHIERAAVDVITACETHLQRLERFYGNDSAIYRRAISSWHRHLAALFSLGLGAHTHIGRDGDMSLLVTAGSGLVYAIIWHGDRRRCTIDGCAATIGDDRTITAAGASDMPAHEHRPSYPLEGPQPGEWISHS